MKRKANTQSAPRSISGYGQGTHRALGLCNAQALSALRGLRPKMTLWYVLERPGKRATWVLGHGLTRTRRWGRGIWQQLAGLLYAPLLAP